MPKNTVTDPITDQEMAFAHLILAGTMTDRRAAEAVGLNPDTAAYTKAKPRVRDYMTEHRAAVKEKLVEQEAEGLRKLNIRREQILDRLWELATLSHEATRGSITGQMKALSMIAAIEGLIPDRRLSPKGAQPAPPPIKADEAEWLRKQKSQSMGEESGDPAAVTEAQPDTPQPAPETAPGPDPKPANHTSPPGHERNQPAVNPFINPVTQNWVPDTTGYVFDALLNTGRSFELKLPDSRFSGRRRGNR
jgi:hypothetical protein